MPKRKTVEYYERKIRKLKENPKRRRRHLVYSSSSDAEANEDVGTHEEYTGPTTTAPLPEPEPVNIAGDEDPADVGGDPVLGPELTPEEPSVSQIQPADSLDLDPALLSALGDAVVDTPTFGENIHTSLAQRWLPILRKGLLKDCRTKLLNDYPIPENCKLLKAPTLNFEISAAVVEVVRNRDKSIQTKQDQLGHGIAAISKAITILLSSDDKVNTIKVLSDGCRLLTDLHYSETELRTKLITPCLQKSFLTIIETQDRDETLFDTNLSDKIKSSQTIERQGHQIKKSVFPKSTAQASTSSAIKPRYSENWQGPPRYPLTSRGGRGGTRRAPMSQYRRWPPANAAPAQAAPAPATAASARPATAAYPGKRAQRH